MEYHSFLRDLLSYRCEVEHENEERLSKLKEKARFYEEVSPFYTAADQAVFGYELWDLSKIIKGLEVLKQEIEKFKQG